MCRFRLSMAYRRIGRQWLSSKDNLTMSEVNLHLDRTVLIDIKNFRLESEKSTLKEPADIREMPR